jgi:arylsulfatase A-like enzyme
MSITRRALLASLPLIHVKAAAPKRNVLFLAIDDLNDWIGCMGGQAITPNLDKLAKQGVVFTSAHCAAPLCNPARTGIMTGKAPASTGVYENNQPYHTAPALQDVVTLNQHFKNNGYLAFTSGKIYHGTVGKFADMKNWTDIGRERRDYRLPGPKPLAGAAGNANFDFGATVGGDEEMNDYHVADWISSQFAKRRDQPLFIAGGIYKPHLPWYVPQKYFDMYPLDAIQLPIVKEDDLNDIPAEGLKMARAQRDHERLTKADAWKKAVQAYLASITFADTMVGRILSNLENSPYANDMDVVLWSDHGWHLGEKLHWRKFTLWERSTRNVLMGKFQGYTRPGGVCGRPVSMLDLYPTLTEVCGLPKREGLDGQSLTGWLKSPVAPKNDAVVTTFRRGNHAVRSAEWRFIRYHDGGEELYDRRKDPNEWTNLAGLAEFAARKTELAKWLPKHNEPDAPTAQGGAELENA